MIAYLFVVVFTVAGSPPETVIYEKRSGWQCELSREYLAKAKVPDSVQYKSYCFAVPTRRGRL